MKKIAIITAILLAFSVSSAFAVGTYATTLTVGTFTVQLSNKVSMAYVASTGGLGYVVGASHDSGTKTFGSSSGDAKIFWTDSLKADLPAAPTGTASAGFTWTAL